MPRQVRIAIRSLVATVVLVVVAGAWSAPAGAIETAQYGIAPADGTQAFHLVPGGKGAVRVFNKTDAPLTVQLAAASAHIDDAGKVAIGGPVGAVRFDHDSVQLGAHADTTVSFRATRQQDGADPAFVVLAEPAGADHPGAIVQRLAVAAYLDGVGPASPLVGLQDRRVWAASAATLLVLTAVALVRQSRRRPLAVVVAEPEPEPSLRPRLRRAAGPPSGR